MISVEQALERILSGFTTLPSEVVGLDDALGRVLAQDVVARVSHPPQAVSAMDGYAVRSADVSSAPATLTVVGEAPAGGSYDHDVEAGQAVRIYTGGPVPKGTDAVVIQEDTEQRGDQVTIKESAKAGQFVRAQGLDFARGALGLRAGQVITARGIGLAAAMNHPWLTVRRRPRVAILSTGDELVLPGEPLARNQHVSSNGVTLAAFVRANGGDPINLGLAPDQEDTLAALAEGARGADLLVTSGGASVGKHDLVRSALEAHGLTLDFWKIAMRPGKPLMFGNLGTIPMIGLPGNPVSSLVCALLFLGPVLRRLLGQAPVALPSETALLGRDLPANDKRQDYLRARLERDAQGRWVATPFDRQDSAMFATLAKADCLVIRKPLAEPAKTGESVEIIRLIGAIHGI